MLLRYFLILVFGALATASQAAGFVHNENFVVYCPAVDTQEAGQRLAKQVLEFADECRAEIAMQWLGKELPPGVGRTVINIDISPNQDTALTWAKDDPNRRYHAIYLTTSADKVIGSTLKHELTHAVLATRWRHPNRLPAWTEEGIASQYDDESRIGTRRQIVEWFAETGNWPKLNRILQAETISAGSSESYAVAASLTEFLLEKADKETFFQFASTADFKARDVALSKHYDMKNVAELSSKVARMGCPSGTDDPGRGSLLRNPIADGLDIKR